MRRETQNVLLLLLGGALLKIALTGDYLRYVKAAHQPWLIGAGAVTVLLAVAAIVRDLRGAARGHAGPGHGNDHCQDHDHDHDHPARSAWLLLVPVLAVFLVAPPALGADSVTRTRAGEAYTPSASAAFPPLPPGRVVPLPVTDFVSRAGWDESGSLHGRTVRLTGFVVQARGRPELARLVIGCCAADAFAVRVELRGGQADALPEDTWIEVTGELVPGGDPTASGYVPALTVRSLREIPAPADPYEY